MEYVIVENEELLKKEANKMLRNLGTKTLKARFHSLAIFFFQR